MFELNKFVALIGIEDSLMGLFYDKAESAGLNPNFDIYHILAGQETPSPVEIDIMKKMYLEDIVGSAYEEAYLTADKDFEVKLAEKNKKRMG